MRASYAHWRRLHLTASVGLGLLAAAHCVYTTFVFATWTPDAVWFLGTGLGLLLLAALNVSHIGEEPCRLPTTRPVRGANWVFLVFGGAAALAVPEPQAYVIVACLAAQALASRRTLPGPG